MRALRSKHQRFRCSVEKPGGQILLAILLILLVGAPALIYSLVTPAKLTIEQNKKTEYALEQAREALIGFAAAVDTSGPPGPRPGELPCPDINNDGQSDPPCNTVASRIGRLPWKTLRLPDLRDGSGERLWYAVSNNFKNATRSACAGPPTYTGCLNADTPGDYTITGPAPATNVIAAIFAPGAVVGAQVRSAANQNNIAHYLEGGNQDGDANFVSGLPTASFNDKLLPVTQNALFAVVNMRVAKDVRGVLLAYRAINGYYPLPNSYVDGTFKCTLGTYSGRLPLTGGISCLALADWGALPSWYSSNYWNVVTHYAVSGACAAGLPALVAALGLSLCNVSGGALTALDTLTLGLGLFGAPVTITNITTNAHAIVIVTGRALGAQSHNPNCTSAGQCLEDAENADGNMTYVKPSRFPGSNDTLVIVGCGTVVPPANCPVTP